MDITIIGYITEHQQAAISLPNQAIRIR